MLSDDLNKPITAKALNETLYKTFNVKINLEKYSREQLENYRNLLRTKVHQVESQANFNDLLTNEDYQKDKFVLNVLNTRIKEMLGEAKLSEKAVSKKQQKFMGMVYAAKKGGKPSSKEVAKAAKGMSKKDAKDFAKTSHKGLPEKKKKTDEAQVNELSPELLGRASQKAHQQSLGFMSKAIDRGQKVQSRDYYGNVDVDADPNTPLGKATKAKRAQSDKFANAAQQAAIRNQNRKDLEGLSPAMKRKLNISVEEGTKMKKAKPDYLDLDKDGNKKEPMKKAANDKKVKEAAKPDYIDLDKDGNKKEPMAKAAKDAKKKKVAEGRMRAAHRAHHHAKEYMKHHKAGNLEMAQHHRDACEECGGMIQHGPMGETWHMHAGMNKGRPYKVEDMVNNGMMPSEPTAETSMALESRYRKHSAMIAENVAGYLMEDEEDKAKTITQALDMVQDMTSWMTKTANHKTRTIVELGDEIRKNFGASEASTFKSTVTPVLDKALAVLTSSRDELSNAIATLVGERPAAMPMGDEPNMDGDMDGDMSSMEPGADADPSMSAPEVGPGPDEFAASDAAAGGPETLGRMKRESIERGNRLMKILGA